MNELLIQVGEFPDFMLERFGAQYQLIRQDQATVRQKQNARVIITRSNYEITTELMDEMPQLGLIATCGVGYDQIPLDYARQKGVLVTNTPDVLNRAVAELTIGLIFALFRQIPQANHFVQSGQWRNRILPVTRDLSGTRVGIVGLGRIGKEIARMLDPFQVKLSYFGRSKQSVPFDYYDDIIELAHHNDLLVLSAPANPATHHIINASVLQALGKDGYIVNISRGALVDEQALIGALTCGVIAGAALDVFENEPDINPGFFTLDNVVLTPHIGSATLQTRLRMVNLVMENLDSFFAGQPVITPVGS